MGPSKGFFAVLALLLVIGVSGLVHFSQNLLHASDNVRNVDVVGLSGGGAACGAALFGVIFALVGGRRPTEAANPPGGQLPPH
jgi:hypothetical protein